MHWQPEDTQTIELNEFRRKVTDIFYSTFQWFDHFQIFKRFVIANATENRNDDLGRFQIPLIDHKLPQRMKIDTVVDVEKRTRLKTSIDEWKTSIDENSHPSNSHWENLRILNFPKRRRTVVGWKCWIHLDPRWRRSAGAGRDRDSPSFCHHWKHSMCLASLTQTSENASSKSWVRKSKLTVHQIFQKWKITPIQIYMIVCLHCQLKKVKIRYFGVNEDNWVVR